MQARLKQIFDPSDREQTIIHEKLKIRDYVPLIVLPNSQNLAFFDKHSQLNYQSFGESNRTISSFIKSGNSLI